MIKDNKWISQQKAWMSAEVRAVSRANKAAFQSGDKEAHNTTRARLKAAIKEVKTSAPTALKICSRRSRTTPEAGVLGSPVKCIPPPEDQLLSVSTADVRKILLRVKVSKAELCSVHSQHQQIHRVSQTLSTFGCTLKSSYSQSSIRSFHWTDATVPLYKHQVRIHSLTEVWKHGWLFMAVQFRHTSHFTHAIPHDYGGNWRQILTSDDFRVNARCKDRGACAHVFCGPQTCVHLEICCT